MYICRGVMPRILWPHEQLHYRKHRTHRKVCAAIPVVGIPQLCHVSDSIVFSLNALVHVDPVDFRPAGITLRPRALRLIGVHTYAQTPA
jgi:hypothetical protein